MKNRMSAMTGASLGLSYDPADAGAGGGGTATATPAAGGGAGAGGGGESTTGKFNPGSLFAGVRHAVAEPKKTETPAAATETKPEPKTPAAGGAADGSKFQVLDDDGKTVLGEFGSQAEAEAFVQTRTEDAAKTDPAGAVSTATDKLPRKVMGRYETLDQVEEAMRRSQDEGLRLADLNKKILTDHQKALETREAELAALKAEIEEVRTKGIFKELSADELATLRKENPAGYADYLIEKRDRERAAVERKQAAERDVQQRKEHQEEIRRFVETRDNAMRADRVNYPNYEERQKMVEALVDMTREGGYSPFTGHRHSAEILYWAAEGIASHQARQGGADAQAVAAKAAAEKAKADASAAAAGSKGGGGSGGKATATTREAQEKSYKDALRAVGKPVRFGPSR